MQAGAGDGIDCPDAAYKKAGAEILPDAPSVFKASDMIVKVKEPQQVGDRAPRAAAYSFHLPAPRRRQAAGGRPDEVGRDLHRL